jgi:hypothetical protein
MHIAGEELQLHSFITSELKRGEQSASYALDTRLLREVAPVPVAQEAEWAPQLDWTFYRTETCLTPAWFRNSDRPARTLVTILTELYWFLKLK